VIRLPYTRPGEVDLTTSVNFRPLRTVAREAGLRVVFQGPQSDFLRRCGIGEVPDRDGRGGLDLELYQLLENGHDFYVQFLAKGLPNLAMNYRSVRHAPKAKTFLDH
jgi:hypothetical protein